MKIQFFFFFLLPPSSTRVRSISNFSVVLIPGTPCILNLVIALRRRRCAVRNDNTIGIIWNGQRSVKFDLAYSIQCVHLLQWSYNYNSVTNLWCCRGYRPRQSNVIVVRSDPYRARHEFIGFFRLYGHVASAYARLYNILYYVCNALIMVRVRNGRRRLRVRTS